MTTCSCKVPERSLDDAARDRRGLDSLCHMVFPTDLDRDCPVHGMERRAYDAEQEQDRDRERESNERRVVLTHARRVADEALRRAVDTLTSRGDPLADVVRHSLHILRHGLDGLPKDFELGSLT